MQIPETSRAFLCRSVPLQTSPDVLQLWSSYLWLDFTHFPTQISNSTVAFLTQLRQIKRKAEEDSIAVVANSDSKAQISNVKSSKKVYLKKMIFFFISCQMQKQMNTNFLILGQEVHTLVGCFHFCTSCLPELGTVTSVLHFKMCCWQHLKTL